MPSRPTTRQRRSQRLRDKISASKIVDRLQRFVSGEVEMSASQVRAAETLLKKVLPDLKQVDVGKVLPATDARMMSEYELLQVLRDQEGFDREFRNLVQRFAGEPN